MSSADARRAVVALVAVLLALVSSQLRACVGFAGVPPLPIVGLGTTREVRADRSIRCGETAQGTTVSAATGAFSTRDYERWICFPGVEDRDRGGERSFALDLRGHASARVTLRNSYVRLELAALAAAEAGREPPPPETSCETTFPEHDTLELSAAVAERWLLVVEGVDGREGTFEVDVSCR